jgi:hypothetical protein
MAMLGGPMFEPTEDENFQSVSRKSGGHYNNFYIKPGRGMAALRNLFPDGEANDLNVVLFSTSGVHGSYTTIEEIEAGLQKYGDEPDFGGEDWPDDWHDNELTVLIVQPRLCTVRHGNITVTLADIPFLKKLRESSHRELCQIGMPARGDAPNVRTE